MLPPVDFLRTLIFIPTDGFIVPLLNSILNDIVFSPKFEEVVLSHSYVLQPLEDIRLRSLTISSITPETVGNPQCREYNLLITKGAQEICLSSTKERGYGTCFRKFHLPVEDFQRLIYSTNYSNSNNKPILKIVPEELEFFFLDNDAILMKNCKIIFQGTTPAVNNFYSLKSLFSDPSIT